MRTNVLIDDHLINEAFRVTKLKTKKELIKTALQELIENRKKMDLRKIRGKIDFRDDYDYKEMRK
ncbi:MAG: type II toxin-antitoxin system VapB family antitoxin, partial [bacterium]|nr:type II toxin-antitoxin system VapB family antitoxin [bacterium]